MKTLVFDTGPVISLAMNNLLWLIKPLKKSFNGNFYITDAVKRECVERPLTSKKFKFEALQVLRLIQEGRLKVFNHDELKSRTETLLNLANSLFIVQGNYVKIVQYAEIESVVASRLLEATAIVIDEFITRTLLEEPLSVKERLEKRLHLKTDMNMENINKFKKEVKDLQVIRSFELVTVAYEHGLFKDYYLKIEEPRRTLLEGLLWAIKLNGCSVSEQEIYEVLKLEKFS